jgi:hypothetical protein
VSRVSRRQTAIDGIEIKAMLSQNRDLSDLSVELMSQLFNLVSFRSIAVSHIRASAALNRPRSISFLFQLALDAV